MTGELSNRGISFVSVLKTWWLTLAVDKLKVTGVIIETTVYKRQSL